MRKTGFIINVFIMTGSMLIIRLAGMISNVYISARAGAEAMGLYHVIFSVYSFAITLSVSGTGLAATRLITEQMGRKTGADVRNVIGKCLVIATAMSLFASVILFFGAEFISENIISDKRCIPALKVLALSLLPIGASAVLRGHMIAVRKAGMLTVSQIAEEFSAIFVTVALLKNYAGTPYAYMAMIIGNAFSELFAFFFDFVSCRITLRKSFGKKADIRFKNILDICVPIALGSYLRSGLVALENVLIPGKLAQYGIENPLSEYGLIRAMAMQIMLFPTVFIQSFASMLVPEMSEMHAAMRKNGIRYVASLAIKCTLIFSFAAAAVFIKYHDALAVSLYKNKNVGIYLGMLALLAVPMYLDTVVDSMLKGLNEQMSSLKFNIADSILRVIAIWLFLPKYGIKAYIILLYASELFNLSLSLGKLISVSGVRINIREYFLPPATCCVFSFVIVNKLNFSGFVPEIIVFVAIYLLLSYLFSMFSNFTAQKRSAAKQSVRRIEI